jgi:hypothetical protein
MRRLIGLFSSLPIDLRRTLTWGQGNETSCATIVVGLTIVAHGYHHIVGPRGITRLRKFAHSPFFGPADAWHDDLDIAGALPIGPFGRDGVGISEVDSLTSCEKVNERARTRE